jgi:hypothetical protein
LITKVSDIGSFKASDIGSAAAHIASEFGNVSINTGIGNDQD